MFKFVTTQTVSLTKIIYTLKKRKLSRYCAIIDFKKAFDTKYRDLLYTKLVKLDFHNKRIDAVKSVNNNVL